MELSATPKVQEFGVVLFHRFLNHMYTRLARQPQCFAAMLLNAWGETSLKHSICKLADCLGPLCACGQKVKLLPML